jgi:hypothetical protein
MTGDHPYRRAEVLRAYRRAEVLRAVNDAANLRRDGSLPHDVPGVEAVFEDIDDLVGALLLRWHTRLAAEIERSLFDQPGDLEAAVIRGWCTACNQLTGVRLIIDTLTEEHPSPQMASKLRVSAHKDWALMAIKAGQVSYHDETAVPVGRRIEAKARRARQTMVMQGPPEEPSSLEPKSSLFARIRAAFAA